MARFSIINAAHTDRTCLVDRLPHELAHPLALMRGGTAADGFKPGTALNMSVEHRGLVVPDVIANTLSLFIVSERLMLLLQNRASAPSEYLRCTLFNHKGRPAQDVYIVNVLGVIDCADRARTRGVPDPLFAGEMDPVEVLVLNESRIDEQQNILRPAVSPSTIMMRDDLLACLVEANMTGLDVRAQGEPLH